MGQHALVKVSRPVAQTAFILLSLYHSFIMYVPLLTTVSNMNKIEISNVFSIQNRVGLTPY